jgi:hypothetical protein
MLEVSYFVLNQPYVINTVIFFGTFLIAIIWMHAYLHADVMKDLGATCDDPIAKFFNRKLAERCYVDTITKSATWVDDNLDKIVKTLELQQNATNARILGLYKIYDERNKEKAAAYAQRIADKQTAVNELQNTVNDIKTGVSDNEKNITKFIDDYREVLRENISKLQALATGIVNKLNRNMYSTNYKDKRETYVKSYNKINEYIKNVNKDRMFEGVNQIFDLLPEIPADARTGKV